MTTNEKFLDVIIESFKTYLDKNTSRSTAKLKSLHGHIAADIAETFGKEYTITSQGYGNGIEKNIEGRYYPKKVDITVSKDGEAVAGYAIKFVMRNYSQNSNNYFENMLGETANIRSNSIPYFHIFIIFDKVPYFEKAGKLSKYDIITKHNLDKYLALSKDDPALFYHTPDKTLIVLIHLDEEIENYKFSDSTEYANYYIKHINDKNLITYSNKIKDEFDSSVLLNDYENFVQKTYHITVGKLK